MTNTTYRLPSEWEPQWGMMLTWPHEDTDWQPYLDDITNTMTQLAHQIAMRQHLVIAAPAASLVPADLRSRTNVHVCECPTNDTWARDHGPITLIEKGDESEGLMMLDFCFNGWGRKFAADKDNLITRNIIKAMAQSLPVARKDQDDFVLEGGSIETDGCGTVLTTSQCLLAPNRNQPLTRRDIEQQLIQRLHANRVLWLDHGNLIGDDTDGHIDTIVRCAPADTLLYVQSRDINDPQHEDFMALEEQLKTLLTADGRHYTLLPLPMPRAIYDTDGERLPATYANFVIINGAVIVPTYGQDDLDSEAKQTIKQAFPDREIIGIDARTVIRQHGSLHCLTMQIPCPTTYNKAT